MLGTEKNKTMILNMPEVQGRRGNVPSPFISSWRRALSSLSLHSAPTFFTVVGALVLSALGGCDSDHFPAQQSAPEIIFSEDFSTFPAGWTISDANGDGATWSHDNPGGRFFDTFMSEPFMVVDPAVFGPRFAFDEDLVTPRINASRADVVFLSFSWAFARRSPEEFASVDVRVGNEAWLTLAEIRPTRDFEVDRWTLDASAVASHRREVQFRFRYQSPDGGLFFVIDDVQVSTTPIPPDEFEPDDDLASASALPDGESQVHSLSQQGDIDRFVFHLDALSVVRLSLEHDFGTISVQFDEGARCCDGGQNDPLRADTPSFMSMGRVGRELLADDVAPFILFTADAGMHTVRITSGPENLVLDEYIVSRTTFRLEPNNSPEEATELEIGVPQENHTLLASSDLKDWFTFTLEADTEVILETSGVSGDTTMELYDASINLIEFDDDGGTSFFSRIQTALLRGTYFVLIEQYDPIDDIIYTIELRDAAEELEGLDTFEPNNSPEEATELEIGVPQQNHTLAASSDLTDWFTFTLEADTEVILETSGVSGDTTMGLYHASINLIEFDDDGGTSFFSRIQRVLLRGTYFVLIEQYDPIDDIIYTIELRDAAEGLDTFEPDNSQSEAGLITLGEVQRGRSINPADDEDWVRFTIPDSPDVSTSVALETFGLRGETIISLHDEFGLLKSTGTSGVGGFSRLEAELQPGQYFAEVKGPSFPQHVVSEYSLSLNEQSQAPLPLLDSFEPDNRPDQANLLNRDEVQGGHTFVPQEDVDWYRIESAVDTTILLTIDFGGLLETSVRVDFDILDANLNLVESDLLFVSSFGDRVTRTFALPSGSNFLRLRADAETPEYGIVYSVVPPDEYEPDDTPVQATLLVPGVLQDNHSLLPEGDEDWYKIELDAPSQIQVSFLNIENSGDGLFFFLAELLDGALNVLEVVGIIIDDPRVISELPSGSYFIRVRESQFFDPLITRYGIRFDVLSIFEPDQFEPDNAPEEATPLQPGVTQSLHSIIPSDDEDWYSLTVDQPSLIEVLTTRLASTVSTARLSVAVFNSDLVEIARDTAFTDSRLELRLDAGSYFTRVTGDGQNIILDYRHGFSILQTLAPDQYEPDNTPEQATPIVHGELQRNHSIVPGGDIDWVTFSILQESNVALVALGVGDVLRISVFDDSLTLIDEGNSFFGTLPAGQYFARVEAFTPTLVGEYALRLVVSGPDAEEGRLFRFERMWPTLQQPWYFTFPAGVAVDTEGFVYVADTLNDRIQKFSSDGQFITNWGGGEIGALDRPIGIAVDTVGNVYVTDEGGIKKFDQDGNFVTSDDLTLFGPPMGLAIDAEGRVYTSDTEGDVVHVLTSDLEHIQPFDASFFRPTGIAIHPTGFILVADAGNELIQVFDSDFNFVRAWETPGVPGLPPPNPLPAGAEPPLEGPIGITIDRNGDVLVTHSELKKVFKYALESEGVPLDSWDALVKQIRFEVVVSDISDIPQPAGIAVDSENRVLVANQGIQVFTNDGDPITFWASKGDLEGFMNFPISIAVGNTDASPVIYVADGANNKIKVYTEDGQLLDVWGSEGDLFETPRGVAVGPEGNVYVVDIGGIQKFSSNGEFIASTPAFTAGGIDIDSQGFVYVGTASDGVSFFGCVDKYTSDLNFVETLGCFDTVVASLETPVWIELVIDFFDNLYVREPGTGRIHKLTLDGEPVTQWAQGGVTEPIVTPGLGSLALDSGGRLYVADIGRVVVLTTDGEVFQTLFELGSQPGQNLQLIGLDFHDDRLYTVDAAASRVQVFSSLPPLRKSRAIVVAAGGPFEGNNLWDTTQLSANFVFRSLLQQGFSKNSIRYLSSDLDLDLDGNGAADEVDADATNANLQDALLNWAAADGTEEVILYMVDHGGPGTFRMSGMELLLAPVLGGWIDTLQSQLPPDGTITIVYDACESGTFQDELAPMPNERRIVITSTSAGESAYFLAQGSISFSMYFWTNILNGQLVGEAFQMAKQGMQQAIGGQTPLLVDGFAGALAEAAFIGNATIIQGDVPAIGNFSPPQSISGRSTATLWADPVEDPDGIARVWATLRPPNFVQGSSTNPILELPTFDLRRVDMSSNRFEAEVDAFTVPGLYQVAIYARDRFGNTTSPHLTTVGVDSPLSRKAVIVAGNSSVAVQNNVLHALKALKLQGFTDSDIAFRAQSTFSQSVDGLASLSNLEYLLTQWAREDTFDLVVYLVGDGSLNRFRVNATETLAAETLDGWLDTLQSTIPGIVTVVLDFSNSGSFIPLLRPPEGKKRIVLASTQVDQRASFLSNGDISFSRYFWTRVLNGADLRSAFRLARLSMDFAAGGQLASLDDDGDGIPDEKGEGQLAATHRIGAGIELAGDDPIIASFEAMPDLLSGESTSVLRVQNVTSTSEIDRVFVTVQMPGPEGLLESTIDLTEVEQGVFAASFDGFGTYGVYRLSAVAVDVQGNSSIPVVATVTQLEGPDVWEDDDSFDAANWIGVDGKPQSHNIHDQGDEDWVLFFAEADDVVTIETFNLGFEADTMVEIHRADGLGGTILIDREDDNSPTEGFGELLLFRPSDTHLPSDFYYVRVRFSTDPKTPFDPPFGPNSNYDLRVFREIGQCGFLSPFLSITVTNGQTGSPVSGASLTVILNGEDTEVPFSEIGPGSYLAPGAFSVDADYQVRLEAAGFTNRIIDVDIVCGEQTLVDVPLQPSTGPDSPVIDVTPTSHEFGAVEVDSSATHEFTVNNLGGETLMGTAEVGPPFFIDGSASYSVTPGASAIVQMSYRPTRESSDEASGILTFTGGGGTNVIVTGLKPSDRDNDGISDEQELVLGTDPDNPDSDGDGFRDGLELDDGTDPNDAQSNLPKSQAWVEIGRNGIQKGTFAEPVAALNDALPIIIPGGTVTFLNSGNNPDPAPFTVTTASRIEASSGTVVFGAATRSSALHEQPQDPVGLIDAQSASGIDGDASGPGSVSTVDSDDEAGDIPIILNKLIFEPVLPFTKAEDTAFVARFDARLSLRLRADDVIDTGSLWANITGYGAETSDITWTSADGHTTDDLWVHFTAPYGWIYDGLIEALAGAETLSGRKISSDYALFWIESESEAARRTTESEETVWQPDAVDAEASRVILIAGAPDHPELDSAPGPIYTIRPDSVYDEPQRVWLPLPDGADPNAVEIFYYHPKGPDRGWYPADNVLGWLVPDSALTLDLDGVRYLGLLVRHAAIVHVGEPRSR